ncbi:HlyD family type I secretion periplasmic adaptor subunit [Chitinibacter sp. ZOR0017]|uniref:HlyD family type I secretion periplasmic adaptor subunit n=1 Tax=Chitinibacter sp. ZOR0017 TaxID=1339254 RepID=UPI0006461A05|nr:HlyD family type I secretion periplasmic adaptor subunit [Chitinibacter sp. ZOR0017]
MMPQHSSSQALLAQTQGQIQQLLEDPGMSPALRRSMWLIVLLVLAFLFWAVFSPVNELARARGEVIPSGYVQVLQTQTGGVIEQLLVREGDTVKAGQLVARFKAVDVEKRAAQANIRLNSLAIDRERMLALLEGRAPDFSPYEADYPRLVRQAQSSYREQKAVRDAALTAKRSEGGQQTAQQQAAQRDIRLVESQLNEARQRIKRLEEGVQKGVISQLALSEARQQASALEERLSDLQARVQSIGSGMGAIDADLLKIRADLNQQLSLELSKTTEAYRELEAELAALTDNQRDIEVKSPVAGVVTNLPHTQAGSVIPPGGTVAEVVPTGQGMFLEVMVSPRDIGFVKNGQTVTVKVDSFDSARFGTITGTVQRVSPTSSKLPPNNQPFYRVEVALGQTYVGQSQHQLVPGMTAEADIVTGRKSVLQFLLKPVYTATDTAFHER